MKRLTMVVSLFAFSLALISCGGSNKHQEVTVNNKSSKLKKNELFYSFPMHEQKDVPVLTTVVVAYLGQFSAEIDKSGNCEECVEMFQLTSAEGDEVDIKSIRAVDDGFNKIVKDSTSFVLNFDQALESNTEYQLSLTDKGKDLKLPTGDRQQSNEGKLTFTTAPAFTGSLAMTREDTESFAVDAIFPDNSKAEPLVDFSTIDIRLNQPIDPSTVKYGETVKLEQDGKLVDASVLVSRHFITIDPKNQQCDDVKAKQSEDPDFVKADCLNNDVFDLKVGEPLELTITDEVKSDVGTALEAVNKKNLGSPQSTTPRGMLVLEAPVASDTGQCFELDDEGNAKPPKDAKLSALTGDPINCVPLLGNLLGSDLERRHTESAQAGYVYTQLGNMVKHPEVSPLRINKSSLLKGGALDVFVGGEVSAILSSGPVTVTWLSDSNGYLKQNPYTSDPRAPKLLLLKANMTFDTEEPRTNGAFAQNLLHVDLIGIANVDSKTGEMKVDAIGSIEPNVLATENAFGLLAFHMDSFKDQLNLGVDENGDPIPQFKPDDDRQPELLSWVPGDLDLFPLPNADVDYEGFNDEGKPKAKLSESAEALGAFGDDSNLADFIDPSSPLILNFNKPIDPDSIVGGSDAQEDAEANLELLAEGEAVDFSWSLQGSSLVIQPSETLDYSTKYTVRYNAGGEPFTDFVGTAPEGNDLTFAMPLYVEPDIDEGFDALITSLYPGYPCVTDAGSRDLENDDQGYCINKAADGTVCTDVDVKNCEKTSDHIPVQHVPGNREISVVFSQVMDPETFENGNYEVCEANTDGSCADEVAGKFTIDGKVFTFTPDEEWQEDKLYRFALKSREDGVLTMPQGDADGPAGVLRTGFLVGECGDASSNSSCERYADYETFFRGTAANDVVLKLLFNLPTSDVNGNLAHDAEELEPCAADNGDCDNELLTDLLSKLNQKDSNGRKDRVVELAEQLDNPRALYNSIMLQVNEENTSGGLVTDAEVMCPDEKPDCKNPGMIYTTNSLTADIVGFKSIDEVDEIIADTGVTIPNSVHEDIQNAGGALLINVNPAHILGASVTLKATVLGLIEKELATGPQDIRMRHTCNPADTDRPCGEGFGKQGQIPGWLYNNSEGQPQISIDINTYFDAPDLAATLDVSDLTKVLDGGSGALDILDDVLGLLLDNPVTNLIGGILGAIGDDTPVQDLTDLLAGLAGEGKVDVKTNLHNLPIDLSVRGPVSIMPDGRLQIGLTNKEADSAIQANVSIPVLDELLGVINTEGENVGTINLDLLKNHVYVNYIIDPIVN